MKEGCLMRKITRKSVWRFGGSEVHMRHTFGKIQLTCRNRAWSLAKRLTWRDFWDIELWVTVEHKERKVCTGKTCKGVREKEGRASVRDIGLSL